MTSRVFLCAKYMQTIMCDHMLLPKVYLLPQENDKLAAKLSLISAANAVCAHHLFIVLFL